MSADLEKLQIELGLARHRASVAEINARRAVGAYVTMRNRYTRVLKENRELRELLDSEAQEPKHGANHDS